MHIINSLLLFNSLQHAQKLYLLETFYLFRNLIVSFYFSIAVSPTTKPEKIASVEEIAEEITPRPAAVLMQFLLLYKRNLLIARRSYVSTLFLFIRYITNVM